MFEGFLKRLVCLLVKPIADAGFGQDVARLRGVVLEFLPQVPHVDAQVVRTFRVARAPHLAQ